MTSDQGPGDPQRQKLSGLQLIEATAAGVLVSAIVSSTGGIFWLIVSLPQKLNMMEQNLNQLVRLVGSMEPRLDRIEIKVTDHEGRLERLEP